MSSYKGGSSMNAARRALRESRTMSLRQSIDGGGLSPRVSLGGLSGGLSYEGARDREHGTTDLEAPLIEQPTAEAAAVADLQAAAHAAVEEAAREESAEEAAARQARRPSLTDPAYTEARGLRAGSSQMLVWERLVSGVPRMHGCGFLSSPPSLRWRYRHISNAPPLRLCRLGTPAPCGALRGTTWVSSGALCLMAVGLSPPLFSALPAPHNPCRRRRLCSLLMPCRPVPAPGRGRLRVRGADGGGRNAGGALPGAPGQRHAQPQEHCRHVCAGAGLRGSLRAPRARLGHEAPPGMQPVGWGCVACVACCRQRDCAAR